MNLLVQQANLLSQGLRDDKRIGVCVCALACGWHSSLSVRTILLQYVRTH